jgi:hypothetical protein
MHEGIVDANDPRRFPMSEIAVKSRFPAWHLPDLDLAHLDLGRIDVPDAMSKVELPKVELPTIDVRQALSGAAAAVHVGRRSRRPRWGFAVALAAVGVAGWAIVRNVALRDTVNRRIAELRDRFATRAAPRDPVAFDSASTAPLRESPFHDPADGSMADYPAGLGSSNGTTSAALSGSERLG